MNDEHDPDAQHDPEEDFAALLETSLGRTTPLQPGQKIAATLLQIGAEWAFLDVGQKGEGVLDVRELLGPDGELSREPGDKLEVYFISRQGGELRFTTRIGGGNSGTAELEEAWRSGIPVEGRIEKEVKGGYEIRLPGNVRAFCPFSQLGLHREGGAEDIIGATRAFKISRFSEQGRNIVVSRRELLEEERQRQREALQQTLKEGDVVTGKITSLRDFGAFVDIGGIEGLLPVSEVAYGRVDDLQSLLQVGQQLQLAVKSLDWERNRFSFSLRDLLADPWSQLGSRYREGQTLTGTVARLVPFGAFVTLEEGVDGLIHISRLGQGRQLKHAGEVLQPGQQLAVTIEKIDLDQRRISLLPAAEETAADTPNSYSDRPAGGGMGTFADLLKGNGSARKKP
ncbi:30S ribosomal protein S1 [Desulfuromonas carbonis]|uniref:S1 RNA-binding domain-containing protein n=1 Tax=Desulfuromonas sp. DDH964 TaxID=1823759 RepID=UPI00078DB829|nr:S1 RNA-binding domain-containing protein [Desulfuromonas sp. DDH964]AMV70831.1 30S ribosomal protein S1 [Desulfuromonas sp. DDH964]